MPAFLTNIFNFFVSFPWEGFYYVMRVVFIVLDIALFVGLIMVFPKARKYRPDLPSSFRAEKSEVADNSAFDADMFRKHWEKIQNGAFITPPQSLTLAIMAADNLVGDALKQMGLKGENIADRLEQLSPQRFKTLNDLWRAHKIRNDLVHTVGFEVKDSEAKEILDIYESFLMEIGALK